MEKNSISYKFVNPNSAEDTAEMLFKFFIEVNKPIVDEAMKKELLSHPAFVGWLSYNCLDL